MINQAHHAEAETQETAPEEPMEVYHVDGNEGHEEYEVPYEPVDYDQYAVHEEEHYGEDVPGYGDY